MSLALNKTKVINSFNEILLSLSEKERNVMERRLWINWEKETLQNIGDSFSPSVTRERIRQIEDSWIKKIWRIVKTTILYPIQESTKKIIETHWWVITRELLLSLVIKDLELTKNINSSILDIIIQSDFEIVKSKPKLWAKTYFFLPSITSKKDIELIHKEAYNILRKKKDVMKKENLYELIIKNLRTNIKNLNIVLIDSVLSIFEDVVKWEENLVALTKWKILNPKTLKHKAIYVMKKEKLPMHFIDISNKITNVLWDKVKLNTIHNELIRNDEFVLIGRWIYALKEWWYKPWNVIDVILSVMEKKNAPMTTEEITNEVLKTRNVKKTTIYMNLQNKKLIERVWRNYYQIKK